MRRWARAATISAKSLSSAETLPSACSAAFGSPFKCAATAFASDVTEPLTRVSCSANCMFFIASFFFFTKRFQLQDRQFRSVGLRNPGQFLYDRSPESAIAERFLLEGRHM